MPYNPTFSPEYYRNSQNVLETALNQLGAYKSWRINDPGREYPIDERYAMMPSLTKADIRRHFPNGFLPAECDIDQGLASGEITFVNSSGSTDAKVTNIWNQKFWDASEKASWKFNAHTNRLATGDHREAILVNPLNVGIISDETELPMEKRRLARFLYLNEKTDPLSWSDEYMDRMIKELAIFQPTVLEANPTLLAKLSRYITTHNKPVFQPDVIILTYEYPSYLYLRQIHRVFNAPIASSYGTTETGYVFMQCEAGKFHQNTEFCRVDYQSLKPEQGGPLLGRLLVTTFNNPWYYIVRFDVGDLARLDEQGECSCGRNSGFILSAIEGRVTNVTLTTKGRLVSLRELDESLSVLDGIDEYSLEQLTRSVYHLHLVSQRRDKESLSQQATAILEKLYGEDAEISVVYEDAIAPESSGKYSLAKTSFPLEITSYFGSGSAKEDAAK
jgi:phenylacetate-CoA ligase